MWRISTGVNAIGASFPQWSRAKSASSPRWTAKRTTTARTGERSSGPSGGPDLGVSRREQEHLVRDALHAPVERVREPAGEVDQPLRQLLVGALQIEDDRDAVLELVRDLLRVVEAPRQDEMDAHRGRHA